MAGGERLRRGWNWLLSRSLRRLADAHRHFGNLYGNQQEHWAAIENYTRAVTLDPTYVQAYYSRGVLYWREIGNYYRAIKDLSRVLELDPSWSLAYFNRGLAHRMRRERGKALADFARYLDTGSDPFWLEAARRQMDELQDEAGWVRPISDEGEPDRSSEPDGEGLA